MHNGFIKLLSDYPDAVTNHRKLSGLLNDINPQEPKLVRLLLFLHEFGIHNDIINANIITNQFAYKFVKRLMDEYGTSDENAYQSVSLWCLCYGSKILGKSCELSGTFEDFSKKTSLLTNNSSIMNIQNGRNNSEDKVIILAQNFTMQPGGCTIVCTVKNNGNTRVCCSVKAIYYNENKIPIATDTKSYVNIDPYDIEQVKLFYSEHTILNLIKSYTLHIKVG